MYTLSTDFFCPHYIFFNILHNFPYYQPIQDSGIGLFSQVYNSQILVIFTISANN